MTRALQAVDLDMLDAQRKLTVSDRAIGTTLMAYDGSAIDHLHTWDIRFDSCSKTV
jgi:hypothetical protein